MDILVAIILPVIALYRSHLFMFISLLLNVTNFPRAGTVSVSSLNSHITIAPIAQIVCSVFAKLNRIVLAL